MLTLIFPSNNILPITCVFKRKFDTKITTPTKSSLNRIFRLQRRGKIIECSQAHTERGLCVSFVRPKDLKKVKGV